MPRSTIRRQRGFTLIESTISVAIFIISVTAAMSAIGGLAQDQRNQAERSQAIFVAETVAEQLVLLDSAHADIEEGSHGPEYFDENGYRLGSSTGHQYRASWVVTPDTPIAGARSVMVTVQWDTLGKTHGFAVTTYRD